jgi:malate dehydrogenase (quinone)
MDLFGSVKPTNVLTMLAAGAKNTPLLKYLAQQLSMTKEHRMEELRNFVPNASSEDWELLVAGQRVQLIEDTEEGGRGALQFGTKLIHADDCTMAALLGESPGASVSVSIMLEVLNKCFPDHLEAWEPKLKEIIPSYGRSLEDNPELLDMVHDSTSRTLKLTALKA